MDRRYRAPIAPLAGPTAVVPVATPEDPVDPVDHTYKITEIVGSSSDGLDAAIRSGITRASKTLRNLDWFEVTDIRGAMNEGDIAWFQVTMKVGFRLD
jgi:flavin-binding protein dodecin